jgi:hypothetical protein
MRNIRRPILALVFALATAPAVQAQVITISPAVHIVPPFMNAQGQSYRLMPPVEYDHPYAGALAITRFHTMADVRMVCPNTPGIACALVGADHCLVYILDDWVLRAAGYSYEQALRHEIGHCNGWSGDHPSGRHLPIPPEWR